MEQNQDTRMYVKELWFRQWWLNGTQSKVNIPWATQPHNHFWSHNNLNQFKYQFKCLDFRQTNQLWMILKVKWSRLQKVTSRHCRLNVTVNETNMNEFGFLVYNNHIKIIYILSQFGTNLTVIQTACRTYFPMKIFAQHLLQMALWRWTFCADFLRLEIRELVRRLLC